MDASYINTDCLQYMFDYCDVPLLVSISCANSEVRRLVLMSDVWKRFCPKYGPRDDETAQINALYRILSGFSSDDKSMAYKLYKLCIFTIRDKLMCRLWESEM